MNSLIHPFTILADYGSGFIIVAHHNDLQQATTQAEHRFAVTNAHTVIVRDNKRSRICQDANGKLYEWKSLAT